MADSMSSSALTNPEQGREWAYDYTYPNSSARTAELPFWIQHYTGEPLVSPPELPGRNGVGRAP